LIKILTYLELFATILKNILFIIVQKLILFHNIMEILSIILIAISLSADTFAVSISSGLFNKKILFTEAIRIALMLAIFQGLMPVVGWFVGHNVRNMMETYDHWVAFTLLAAIGLKMIYDGWQGNKKEASFNPMKIIGLLTISVATSIDAMIVGLGFGLIEINIVLAAFIIGSVTFLVAMLGILFGKKTASGLGNKANVIGGLILIGIGVKILVEHLGI